jgi:hypothetical protein
MSSFMQAVYLLELDRQDSKTGHHIQRLLVLPIQEGRGSAECGGGGGSAAAARGEEGCD